MAFKKFRKMKVYEASGYNYKRTPSIILKGDWLKETGFEIGGLIQVECEDGKLIITPREPEVMEYHTPCGQCQSRLNFVHFSRRKNVQELLSFFC